MSTQPREKPDLFTTCSTLSSGRNFTNLGNVKSAASVDSAVSAVSNFGTRTKVEKFNDKRESLRMAKLSKIEFVTNQGRDSIAREDSWKFSKMKEGLFSWVNVISCFCSVHQAKQPNNIQLWGSRK